MVLCQPFQYLQSMFPFLLNIKKVLSCITSAITSCIYTVKVRLLESIFTRYMALFKVPWCLALETSLKRPKQEKCHSKSSQPDLFVALKILSCCWPYSAVTRHNPLPLPSPPHTHRSVWLWGGQYCSSHGQLGLGLSDWDPAVADSLCECVCVYSIR